MASIRHPPKPQNSGGVPSETNIAIVISYTWNTSDIGNHSGLYLRNLRADVPDQFDLKTSTTLRTQVMPAVSKRRRFGLQSVRTKQPD